MMDQINEEWLEGQLTTPSERLVKDLQKIEGDFLVLGAAGKMGPSLVVLLKKGLEKAGLRNRIYAASRFSNLSTKKYLDDFGIETFAGNLLDPIFLDTLPKSKNVIYMAGQKFGTVGSEPMTWAINTLLPGMVAQRYTQSRIVAFSTGNVLPLVSVATSGSSDEAATDPIGEYAQSCLGRERIFEYYADTHATPILIFRLNYALDLRYGVLNDIGQRLWNNQPIDLQMGYVNVIWQGDANEYAIRSLLYCGTPANHLNVTGSDVLEVSALANRIGGYLDREPKFINKPLSTALLSDASKAHRYFGKPLITVDQMCRWTAAWIKGGGHQLNKPTHYQQRDGKF